MILPPDALSEALAYLQRGDLVAMPTETVYGLAGDATSDVALARIFATKGRPADHPLIVHVPHAATVEPWVADLPAVGAILMQAFWPGPLTLVFRRSAHVADAVTGGQDTVAIRCPAHPVAQALLAAFAEVGSGALAAPSANRYGHVSPTSAEHVEQEFAGTIPVLDGGRCTIGIESTIVDVSGETPRILRPGQIDAAAVAAVLGVPLATLTANTKSAPRVPGSHAAHYAPRTRLELIAPEVLAERVSVIHAAGKRAAVYGFHRPSVPGVSFHRAPHEATRYAHDLYATLRDLDQQGHDLLLIESPPQTPAWMAIHDRLRRARANP